MSKLYCLGLLAAALAADAAAQGTVCPGLPAGSNLQWDQRGGSGFTVCRAMDGERQVFGVMLTSEPTIQLLRRNRVEEGTIGGREIYWYQPEIVAQTGESKRVTVVELGKKRYAQIWVDATSEEELKTLLPLVQGIALY